MGEKTTPLGTEKLPENPELQNLRDKEKVLVEKLAKLEKSDANHFARQKFDLGEVKHRTNEQLAEIRNAIKEATK